MTTQDPSSPAGNTSSRDEYERQEVERNMREYGTVYDPYGDTAHHIQYLNAKYGTRGWANFLAKLEVAGKSV